MNQWTQQLMPALALATLWLGLTTLAAGLLLRFARPVSPRVHRLTWCAVLLVGWSIVRLPIAVPWYAAVDPSASELAAEPASLPLVDDFNAHQVGDQQLSLSSPVEVSQLTVDLAEAAELDPAAASEPLEVSLTANLSQVAPANGALPASPDRFDRTLLASAPVSPESVSIFERIDLATTIAAIWLSGMIAIALAWGVGYLWFLWRLPAGLVVDSTWHAEWQELLTARGIARAIPLRATASLGPLLCRLPGGYRLIVPEGLWRDLGAAGRAAILRHELAHYERRDVWWSLAVRLLALPQWFNPCSWIAVRRFDESAEWACDRAVADEHPVTDYARALLRLGTEPHSYAPYRPAAAGKPLASRVRRLLRLKDERDSTMKTAWVLLLAFAMALSALIRVELVAREAPAAEAPPTETAPAEAPPENHSELSIDLKNDDPQPGTVRSGLSISPTSGTVSIDLQEEPSPDDQKDVREAAQAAADAARKAYERTAEAYVADQATLDAVYIWSQRWASAAEHAPPLVEEGRKPIISQHDHRLAVANEHLRRMRQIDKQVQKLFDVGARGGEAEKKAAAEFYVAEAARRVAELKSQTLSGSATLELRAPPLPSGRARSVQAAAPPAAAPTPVVVVPPTAPLPVDPFSLNVLPVHEPVLLTQPSKNSREVAVDPRGKLRYDGKSFAEWKESWQTELSRPGQLKAVEALGAFGANGYGMEVARLLVGAPAELSGLQEAARVAFSQIPRDDAVAVLLEAAKSESAAARGIAIELLSTAVTKPEEFIPLYVAAMQDPDGGVNKAALLALAAVVPDSAEMQGALKSALRNSDQEVVSIALLLLTGQLRSSGRPLSPRPELAPNIVAVIESANAQLAGLAYSALQHTGTDLALAWPSVRGWLAGDDVDLQSLALPIVQAAGPDAAEAVPALIEMLRHLQKRAQDNANNHQVLASIIVTQQHVLAALAAIGPAAKEAVPEIIKVATPPAEFNNNAAKLTVSAVKALGAIGPNAKDAIPLLQLILERNFYGDDRLQAAATDAFHKIQQE